MLFKDHFYKQFNNKVKECDGCTLKSNPGPVLGYGGLNAETMFISDAPKEGDVKTGVPFTGIAKDRMVKAVSDIGFKKGEYYFTYYIKHAFIGDHRPDMISQIPCLELLLEEIELINPKIICSMGFYVTQALMKEYEIDIVGNGLKKIHGNGLIIPSVMKRNKLVRPKRYLIPTWSPSIDHQIMNDQFEDDVLTIKHVHKLKALLINN